MVEQSVPADSVSALRESALAAAGVRGIFTNLIDGKSVGARNTLDVLDPATGELLAKVPDIERDGMDAAFAAACKAFSSWSKLTWEARRAILEKALEKVKAHREELVTLLMAEGGRPRSLALWEVAAVLDDFAPGVLSQSLPDVETTQPVHESRYDEVAAALSKFAAEQVLGDGFDPATTIGPIQNRAQLLRLQATWASIQKDGVAVLYRGDEIEGKGNFFPVTILDNPSPHADYVKLENFGPLRSLIKYGTIDEAIEIANSTDYGLGGSVWGRDPAELDAVAHRMEAGTVWINQHLVVNPNVPFGGNKDSGFGVQYGAEGLKEYCYLRVISAKT